MSRVAVLPPALWHLLGLQWRSQARSAWRGLRTGSGQVYGAIMLGIIGLILYVALFGGVNSSFRPSSAVRASVSLGLFLVWVLWLYRFRREGGVRFERSEIDQLFPAPLHRHELLLYLIVKSTLGIALLSLAASIIVLSILPTGGLAFAVYLGVFLGMSMFSVSLMFAQILSSSAAVAVPPRVRRVVVIGAWSAIAVGVLLVWRSAMTVEGVIREVVTLGPVKLLLFPFRMIVETVLAERVFPNLLLWGGGLLCINCFLVTAILFADADFIERSVAVGERDHERLKQLRRQQSVMGSGKVRGRWRPPLLPFLAGAGPIAWRQAAVAARSEQFLSVLAIVSTCSLGIIAVAAAELMPIDASLAFVSAMLLLLLPSMLRADFRSDLGRLDALKSLPVDTSAMVAGQLAVPVAVGVALWWVFAILLVVMGMIPPRVFWLVCALALPVNVYLFAAENLFCLAFPFTITRGGVGPLHQQGRDAMVVIGKMLAGLLGVLLSAAVGGALWWFTGASMLTVIVGAVVGMSLVAGLAVAGCEWAYERLEPTSL